MLCVVLQDTSLLMSFYWRWICWCIHFGICCVYVMLKCQCVRIQQVYMFVCAVQKTKTTKKGHTPKTHKSARDRFIPHTGSKCAIIFMYHKISTTRSHTHKCILYRIKNVPWRNERLTIYFFYVFKGEPSSDVYRQCCNDMKIKILLCVNYSTINCLY